VQRISAYDFINAVPSGTGAFGSDSKEVISTDSNDDQLAKQRGDHRVEADTARPDVVESKDDMRKRKLP
jgi:hypothetical protein